LIQSLQFGPSNLKFEQLLGTMVRRLQEQSLGFGVITVNRIKLANVQISLAYAFFVVTCRAKSFFRRALVKEQPEERVWPEAGDCAWGMFFGSFSRIFIGARLCQIGPYSSEGRVRM